jgi:hypothetical protein
MGETALRRKFNIQRDSAESGDLEGAMTGVGEACHFG